MEVLYYLVPITLTIVAIGITLFVWAVKNGQMDDLEGPGHSILYEDDDDMIPEDAKRNGPGRARSNAAPGSESRSRNDDPPQND